MNENNQSSSAPLVEDPSFKLQYILKKILPTCLMFLIIVFIYSVVRGTKDALMIPVLGAEVISAVKLYGVFPGAIIFMLLYTALASKLSRSNLFYSITLFFIVFFLSYGFLIFPIENSLNVDFSKQIQEFPRFKSVFLIISHWSASLFYIMAELWGSIMLSLVFWQFANHIYKVSEAKKTYTIFGAVAQFGLIAAGFSQKYFSEVNSNLADQSAAWQSTLQIMVTSVFFAGLILIMIYWYMNKFVLTDSRFFDATAEKKKKAKVKMSMFESFKYVFSSKYIGFIAVLVLAYGSSINLVENVWKNQLKQQYPLSNDYSAFMGVFQIWTGVATMAGMILGIFILRHAKWFTAAILTPLMIFATGVLFFLFILAGDSMAPLVAVTGLTSLLLSVVVGAIQNVLSKATKYSLFDPTKEMAYIPLDEELKMKGKAVVDVVGARLGKSSGAVLVQALLILTGLNLSALTPYIMYIFFFIMICWIVSVYALSKLFEEKVKESETTA